MLEIIENLSQIIWLIPLLVLITSFLESLAVVGVIVPGVVILTALATASGQQDSSLWLILFAGFIGAWLGDSLSFFLGLKFKNKIIAWKIFQNSQKLFQTGENFFQNYGIASIVIGRFVGPMRPFIPIIAGIMQMNPFKFLAINSISAIFWSPAYLLPGYFLGKGLQNIWLPPSSVFVVSWVLGIFILATFCIGYVRKQLNEDGKIYRFLANKLANTRIWSLNKSGKLPLIYVVLLIASLCMYVLSYFALKLDFANIATNFQNFITTPQVWLDIYIKITNFIYYPLVYFTFLGIWLAYLLWQKKYKLSLVFFIANIIFLASSHLVLELTKGFYIEFSLAIYIFLFGSLASFNARFLASNKRHIYYLATLIFLFAISLSAIFAGSFYFLEISMTWSLALFGIAIFNLFLSYKTDFAKLQNYRPVGLGFLAINLAWLAGVLLYLNL